MAVLCRELGLLFLCVPKTGSTAVSTVLRKQFGGVWVPQKHIWDAAGQKIVVDYKHSRVSDLVAHGILSESDLAGLTVAAVTRNPFDWVVSRYVFQRKTWLRYREALTRPNSRLGGVPDWVAARQATLEDVGKLSFESCMIKHFAGRRGTVAEQFTKDADVTILRFERLERDFRRLMQQLGVVPPPSGGS